MYEPHTWSWIFLAVSLAGGWLTLNAYRPARWPTTWRVVCFFAGWLTVELAAHHIGVHVLAAAVFISQGALDAWPGKLALLVSLVSWAALLRLHRRGDLAQVATTRALEEGLSPAESHGDIVTARPLRWRHYIAPFQMRQKRVCVDRGALVAKVPGKTLRADVYYREDRPKNAPVLVFCHGGAWVIGFKRFQAQPMLNRLAAQGWVCISVDYRLSPGGTFPDHVADVNRGIVWAKEHASAYGGDPGFVALSGNSAGGHLAALAGLTWDDPAYKPGFEDADTRVQAVVTFYAAYDLLNRFGLFPRRALSFLLERVVFKTPSAEAPGRLAAASPITRVRPDAPPWFAVHGTHDTITPVEDARRFTESLRATSGQPVCYAEIPDAQHAFEIFRSVRGHHTLRAVQTFLGTVHAQSRPDGLRSVQP